MMDPLPLLLLAALASMDPAGSSAPVALPRIADGLPCRGPDDEIIVCGRRPIEEPYRIPSALRERPLESRNYSWAARARDEREAARYEDQVTGPGGTFQRSRQRDCEWRAERQQLTGRQIDCSVQIPFQLTN